MIDRTSSGACAAAATAVAACALVLAASCATSKETRMEIPVTADVPDAGTPAAHPASSKDPGKESLFFVEGKAGKLRVSDGGEGGTPVLFLHGLGSDRTAWRAQLEHLRRGRRALAYDQRGHGDSARAPDGRYTLEALTDDLEAVVAALELKKFFLVGHSMSGEILTGYAARHPEQIAGLVYADALGDFRSFPQAALDEEIARETAPGFDFRGMFEGLIGPDAKPDTRARVLAAFARADPRAIPALRADMTRFSAQGLVEKCKAPKLAIEVHGNEFPILYSVIDPTAQKKTLAHVSHWLMMDDPGGFDAALDPFVGYFDGGRNDQP